MTTYSVISGVTSSGITLSSGDFLLVSSGGTAISTTVSGGGIEKVFSGGVAEFTTVSNGGYEYVISGGTASFTTVSYRGTEYVFSDGGAVDTTVDSQGFEIVSSGGTTTGTTLDSGGTEYVGLGGTTFSTTVNSGGFEFAFVDGTTSDTSVTSGGAEFLAEGTAISTTVCGGGYEDINSGGTASFTVVSLGGAIDVTYLSYTGGGSASVNSSDLLTVPVGGQTYSQQLAGDYNDEHFQLASGFDGGTQATLLANGVTSSGITVGFGELLVISSGVTVIGTTVDYGAELEISGGGVANSTTLNGRNGPNAGGVEFVLSGGTATDTSLDGGDEFVKSGGSASFDTVGDGSLEIVNGVARFDTVSNGGAEFAAFGGTLTSATVQHGGGLDVDAGGTASFTTVSNGGVEYVWGATTVFSDGQFVSAPGGTTISTTVSSGGAEFVYSGGATASGTVVYSGGYLVVAPGGTQTGTVLSGGAIVSTGVVVYQPGSGTTAYPTVASTINVGLGGVEVVLQNGTADFTTVSGNGDAGQTGNGAVLYVYSGGTAISTTLNGYGIELLGSGSFASDTVVNVSGAIDVAYLSYTSGGSASVNTSDLLTVSVGGSTYAQQLSGNYADVHFQLARDAGTGTFVTALAGVPCYRSGTLILTDRGEVAVEDLRVGDLVWTVLGEGLTPIIWNGQREVDCARHPKPRKVWPVRIAAGAFGPGRPHTNLFLSPDHAVYVGEVLIPIRHLINGGTISQVPVDRVSYFHIELPRHDVVLAQGLPAESFLDLKDGSNYANLPGPVRPYPDYTARMWEAFGCARLVVTGPELAAARALVARFAMGQAAA